MTKLLEAMIDDLLAHLEASHDPEPTDQPLSEEETKP